jgi:hypothetical protein
MANLKGQVRCASSTLSLLNIVVGIMVFAFSFKTVFTVDTSRYAPDTFSARCTAWTACPGDVRQRWWDGTLVDRIRHSLVDYTELTSWVVLVAVAAAMLAPVAYLLSYRSASRRLLWGYVTATAVAALLIWAHFTMVVQQHRPADLPESNAYYFLRPTAWGVAILVASAVMPFLAVIAARLSTVQSVVRRDSWRRG